MSVLHSLSDSSDHLLPGVMKPDTVHSLNRSTDFRYLSLSTSWPHPPLPLTSHCLSSSYPRLHPGLHLLSSGSHVGPARLPSVSLRRSCGEWRSTPPIAPSASRQTRTSTMSAGSQTGAKTHW